jgi:hypothetical protein
MTSSAPSRVDGFPAAASGARQWAQPAKSFKYSLPAEVAPPVLEDAIARVSQNPTALELETKLGVVSMAGTLIAEPVVQSQSMVVDDVNQDIPSIWEARNPLLYNSTPPIYSAPYNSMSLFPLNPGAEADAAVARMREFTAAEKTPGALMSAVHTNPFSAIILTVLFAFVASIAIFSYIATSGVSDLLLRLGR